MLLKNYFEMKNNTTMDSFSSYQAAKEVKMPVLIIHDENDDEIPVNAAFNIQKHLQHGKIVITKGLGHRKILGNKAVIESIKQFITN